MSVSVWHRDSCGDGRLYQLAKNVYRKYQDEDNIINNIKEGIKKYINIDSAVRITTDTPLCTPERAVISVPFEANSEGLLENFARTIYQSLIGYYLSADPKSTHFGISNLALEGDISSIVRRELEKMLYQFQNRDDIAGRLLQSIKFVADHVTPVGDTYLNQTLHDGLDIQVGYRLVSYGKDISTRSIFIPIQTGKEIIDLVYYNLEQIIHHNFVAYDETGDRYLNITDTLIFKEAASVVNRAKAKENTRKKLLNNLQFTTVFTEDPAKYHGGLVSDPIYDQINRIQEENIRHASDRSRELYASCMIRAAEITSNSIHFRKLEIGEHGIATPDLPSAEEAVVLQESASTTTQVPKRAPVVEGEEEEKGDEQDKKAGIASRFSLKRDTFQEI